MNRMHTSPGVARCAPFFRSLLLGAAFATVLSAQTSVDPANKPGGATKRSEPVLELSAFEVRAEKDNSYGALNSASITRFSVPMKDLPVSADIFTDAFIKDVATTSVEELVQGYSAGAGYADGSDNGSTTAANNQPGDRNGNAYIQIRGMHTPVMQRDSFMPVGAFGNPGSTAVGRTDSFDLERVEVINGPQALLYGGGGAGGVINVTSKQARFGSGGKFLGNARGAAVFRIDDFGTRRGELDFGLGNRWMAARVAFLHEDLQTRRVNIGGITNGQYAQLAFRLMQDTFPTTVRISGSATKNKRLLPRAATLNAPGDTRNGLQLHYILATNQQGATDPVSGAAYTKGAIVNGQLNWDNVDSFAAGTMYQEPVTNEYSSITIDTKWADWLSTQVAAGYDVYTARRINPGFTFYAPRASANATDDWAVGLTPQDSQQPARTKAGRFAFLITKDFFGGKAKTQTLIGADYVSTFFSQDAYRWYRADDDWNAIVAPGTTITSANSGRTPLGQLIWSINGGPVLDPFPGFNPALDRAVIGGVKYVRALVNQPQASLVTPANPLGVPFSSGNYIKTSIVNRGFYVVNYSQWFGGKFNTLAGLRQGDYISLRLNHPDGKATRWDAKTSKLNFNLGVDYNVNRWLHPYINYSDSVQPPYTANRGDPHNNAPQSARGVGGEIGLKINNDSGSISGSLAFFQTKARGDLYSIDSSIAEAINPTGLNGGGGGTYVSIDRVTRGAELRLTAAPSRSWRLRFGLAANDGKINTSRAYEQYYNDQFYANAQGQVTYRDGTPVFVNGNATSAAQATVVASSATGAVPLTINLMSTPGATNLYFANPDLTSGAIRTGTIVANILSGLNDTANINARGPILTGKVNLPIDQLQLNKTLAGIVTPGTIVATRIGDKTTGYPEWSTNLTANYSFPNESRLKGLSIGGTGVLAWHNRGYYYFATPLSSANALTQKRTLFFTPDTRQLNLVVSYSRKFGRIEWSTQLNVTNVFDRYTIKVIPNATTGFNTLNNINATWYQQPRSYVWTNTLKF